MTIDLQAEMLEGTRKEPEISQLDLKQFGIPRGRSVHPLSGN